MALDVVRSFTARIRERALGTEVSQSLNPAQQVVKIVNEELTSVLGAGVDRPLNFAKNPPTIIMLAGLQGAGKTTLAQLLQQELGGRVFHMDDFFLRPEQRTAERLARPGENVDHERFLAEVLDPARQGLPVTFRPYLCRRQALGDAVHAEAAALTVVEGAYACHPALWDSYDLRVFLTVEPDEQLRRIQRRSGPEQAAVFRTRWIPLEEQYFAAFSIPQRCDILLHSETEVPYVR